MAEPWTCTSCYDTPERGRLLITGDKVCTLCFRQLFALAIQSEENYPPRWGKTTISSQQYGHLLDTPLREAYEAKVREYACPLQQRVYCQRTDPPRRPDACGTFVGKALKRKECVKCTQCAWYTCLRCRDTFSTSDVVASRINLEHDCDPFRIPATEAEAFLGLVQGRDYQICPSADCGRKVELLDGCNKMSCVCLTTFCFICGLVVKPDDWHWRPGSGCPRWGQPKSGTEIYDRFGAAADEVALEREIAAAAFRPPIVEDGWGQIAILEQRWRQQREDEARAVQVQVQLVREAQEALVQSERERRRRRVIESIAGPVMAAVNQADEQAAEPQHGRRRRRRHSGAQIEGPTVEREREEREEIQPLARRRPRGWRETLFGGGDESSRSTHNKHSRR
ncbi:hypothetical protein B0A48_00872 [Cryoendolithus antarcticus]|uniref:IBR domain-containing protein n=1 Tax=Cryoendolithus antarcticus TaxID=1507870 RepID=A0A1V8TRK6_9PEZI|nr:hypothetical protein B0A48_00872 [Cryoendolithus antarcticus]